LVPFLFVRGAPYHPQTQGKIERWHQTLKNRILLENYYLPGDLEASIGRFSSWRPSRVPSYFLRICSRKLGTRSQRRGAP
jgi:transposase InsO family protein